MVQSFSHDEETWYEVQVEDIKYGPEEHPMIVACDCPAYKLHQLKCKHMFLAGRLTGISLGVKISNSSSSSSSSQSSQPSPAILATSQQILTIKEARRSRIMEEERKIRDLVGRLGKMDLEGVSRDELAELETRAITLRRERSQLSQS